MDLLIHDLTYDTWTYFFMTSGLLGLSQTCSCTVLQALMTLYSLLLDLLLHDIWTVGVVADLLLYRLTGLLHHRLADVLGHVLTNGGCHLENIISKLTISTTDFSTNDTKAKFKNVIVEKKLVLK